MKLISLNENRYENRIKSKEFRKRLLDAYRGHGKSDRDGLFGIVDEFGVSLNDAVQYAKSLSNYNYGEGAIDDLILYKVRAPQNLLKLLRYFNVDSHIINKLFNFHIKNKSIIASHKPSPENNISLRQLMNDERLASLIDRIPEQELHALGLETVPTPWSSEFTKYNITVFYVCKPHNLDVVNEMIRVYSEPSIVLDILHGLAFGYRMQDVFNYIRSRDMKLVDSICGNVNEL